MSICLSKLTSKERLSVRGAGVSSNRLLKERRDLASDTREPGEFQLGGHAATLDAGACADRTLPECANAPAGPPILKAGEVFDGAGAYCRCRSGVVEQRIDRTRVGIPMAG